MIVIRHFQCYNREDWHETEPNLVRIGKPFTHMFVIVLDLPYDFDYNHLGRESNRISDEFIKWMTDSFGPFDKKNPTWWVQKSNAGFLRVFTNDPKIVMLINLTWKGTDVA